MQLKSGELSIRYKSWIPVGQEFKTDIQKEKQLNNKERKLEIKHRRYAKVDTK